MSKDEQQRRGGFVSGGALDVGARRRRFISIAPESETKDRPSNQPLTVAAWA